MIEITPGHWELRASAGKDPLTGKYRTVTRRFVGNKTAARKARAELLLEVQRGKHTGTQATLGTLLERWLDKIEGDRSPRTMDGYRMNVRYHILPALAHVPLNKLEPETLDTFYASLKKGSPHRNPLAVATVRQIHAIIRAALNQAVRWQWIPTNPALLADPGSLRPVEHHPPAPEAVLRLIEAAEPEVAVFLRVSAATGARRGEVCALRWEHIDLTTGVVRIERSIIQTGTGKSVLVDKTTKTNQRRKVRLDPDTIEVLRQHRMRWVERARTFNLTLNPSAYVFSSSADASVPLRPDSATQAVTRLRDRLGMPGLRLHDLRHFVATQLLADGVPVKAVADRLGHADVATTLRVYAHALEAADVEAAASMGRILTAKNG